MLTDQHLFRFSVNERDADLNYEDLAAQIDGCEVSLLIYYH